ncbi:chymotrypsin-2-like [Topomyia yanbarensis]|uniref:chymotrypsin-2-like n=1 Tax=Topomyia yanbarensis TaxID=2498891 RepID=UPI00273BCAA6|nr:chymotrypsin-2-like [Topomyia yanbarensis]
MLLCNLTAKNQLRRSYLNTRADYKNVSLSSICHCSFRLAMFRFCFVLFCLIGAALAVPTADKRIVGGFPAESGEAPWMVSMRNSLNSHFCGGTLLNQRFVLTTAVCMSGRLSSTTMAVVGSRFLNTVAAPYYGLQTIVHPQYNANTLEFNVALFQTIQNVVFTSIVQPIQLGANFVNAGSRARMYGWGPTETGGSNSNALQTINLNVIDNDICRSSLGADGMRVGASSLCTLTREGQGLCTNDAGGALVLDNLAIGVASWKIPCATGRPDVFVRISTIRDWVVSII